MTIGFKQIGVSVIAAYDKFHLLKQVKKIIDEYSELNPGAQIKLKFSPEIDQIKFNGLQAQLIYIYIYTDSKNAG